MKRLALALAVLTTGVPSGPVPAAAGEPKGGPTAAWLDRQEDSLVTLYKHLHQNPELSFREEKTSARVADELKGAGLEVTRGVGKFGVVGVLDNGKGPTVLIRTDLDALPVTEETGLDYASKARGTDAEGKDVGVMHACGHDVHMSCFVGTARWLAEHRGDWSGRALFVAQPAEELVSGAKAMLADGLYSRFPRPDYALALHVINDEPAGTVTYTTGPAFAGSTSLNITVKGRGGHGAAPHLTVDPIFLSALFVVDLQSVISREVDPIEPCVITVGSIQGGNKHNIIPGEVKLQLTLRAYSDSVRDQLVDGLKRRLQGLAEGHRAEPAGFEVVHTTPPTVNTPDLVRKVVPTLRDALGADKIKEVPPVMGSEDFGLFGQEGIPTFMFRVGTVASDRLAGYRKQGLPPSLHSSRYYPDPAESIRTGVRAMSAAAVGLMPSSK